MSNAKRSRRTLPRPCVLCHKRIHKDRPYWGHVNRPRHVRCERARKRRDA